MIEDRNAAKPIVIAGHSHSVCFGLPHAKQEGVRLVELRQDPLIFGVEAPWPRPTDFTEQVCALAKGKKLLLSYSGWSKLLFAPDPLFDFVSSHFPSLPLDPEARLLPESLVLNHDDLRLYPRWINNAFRLFQRGGIDDMLILCMPHVCICLVNMVHCNLPILTCHSGKRITEIFPVRFAKLSMSRKYS